MKFRVSLAQINPTAGDLRGNAGKILEGIARAREEKCDLVAFPEMALTGYCLDEKLLISRDFLAENRRLLMEEILPASEGIAVITGFVDFDEGHTGPGRQIIRYNAAAVMQAGRLLQIVHKRLLPAYRYFDDKRYFTAGTEAVPVEIRTSEGTLPIGVLICEDLWEEGYDFKPCAAYCEKGARYLFSINASPFVGSHPGKQDGKRFVRAELIQKQIARYGIPVLYLNTVGVGDNGKNVIPFDGMSVVYDAKGRLVASLRQFAEEQQTVCLEEGEGAAIEDSPFDREEEIFQALVMGVKDYYDKLGFFKGVLQTLSGGIDSALGTVIAFEAVGRELLSAYNLPSRYNSEETQRLARELAENLGLEYHVVPIQGMVDRVVEDFEKYLRPFWSPVTAENLQARIRGLIMMAESNDRGALLLTNGNETEIALGYATLYGDMAGGLSVIGDLNKPDVYALARHANRRRGRELIPEGVFRQQPSAELRPEQVDPFDYEVVGPIVSAFVESGCGPEDLAADFKKKRLSREVAPLGEEIYTRYTPEQFRELVHDLFGRLNRSVYKRLQGAPIIVVSERAFGFDLRESIINGWTG